MTSYQGGGVARSCSISSQTQEFGVLVASNVLILVTKPLTESSEFMGKTFQAAQLTNDIF